LKKLDKDVERYTRRRMRQLRGEEPEKETLDPFVEEYTKKRLRELRLERELEEREIDLDNVLLGGYTVATMEAISGKS